MKKILALLFIVFITVEITNPIEAQARTKGIDTCPYAVGGTLGGKEIVSVEKPMYGDGILRGYKITFADGAYARYSSLDSLCFGDTNNLEYEEKYMICRTDFSDGLVDADGNGIDDRDPLNGCGYTDKNYNCVADGAPHKIYGNITDWRSEPYLMVHHHCEHNIVEGGVLYCPTCAEIIRSMPKFH